MEVGPGAKPGMWFAMQCLLGKGDAVLSPDPGFPTYSNTVHAFGGGIVKYNALKDGEKSADSCIFFDQLVELSAEFS